MKKKLDLSIVVPFFNEEESIAALYKAIVDAVSPLDIDYEMIFVDDGSQDSTFEKSAALAKQDARVRVIKFRRNYGQTPAMAAGIDHARGAVIVTMDGDLQNDPADIGHFLQKIDEGYDIVVGWRHKRQDTLITRKIPSKIANWLIGKVTGVPIKDNGCSLKAYRADVIQQVPLYSEMHRFIPAMASITGAKIAEIKVRHHARQFGTSKYGLSRVYKVLLDLFTIKTIVSFSLRPMLWFGILALPAALLSIGFIVWQLVKLVTVPETSAIIVPGLGILLGSLAFYLVFGGALGELIVKTSDRQLHRLSTITAKYMVNIQKG